MSIKIVATNRKAGFRYFMTEKFEAGLILTGSEVKSLRNGKATISEAYVISKEGELYLLNAHINRYDPASHLNHDPLRTRKLLLHDAEIERLLGKMKEKGLALIPTKIYFKGGRAKIEIALAKGKKLFDKRETLKKKTHDREIQKALKQSIKS